MFADVDYKGNEIWRKNWGNITEGTLILNSRMIYSTIFNKNTNEDPKTSMVFENLMLLPDSVFWDILKNAASNQGVLPKDAGLLTEFSFWPKWEPHDPYETGNENYVEPDVFFRFKNIDVIIEAKYSDYKDQKRNQWESEFKAYLNEYRLDKKPVVILAVGGNNNFDQEPDLVEDKIDSEVIKLDLGVDGYRCPIVKYSWVNFLKAVLNYEAKELSSVQDESQSSMKRIIRTIELGFNIMGISKYDKKVKYAGLSDLFGLGEEFLQAIRNGNKDYYSLVYYRVYISKYQYGYQFEVKPKNSDKKPIWLSIAYWLENQGVITIGANSRDDWAGELCKMIEDKKPFFSKYATEPYEDKDSVCGYCFDANETFLQDFDKAETYDAQVDLISKLIDEVCMYYLK